MAAALLPDPQKPHHRPAAPRRNPARRDGVLVGAHRGRAGAGSGRGRRGYARAPGRSARGRGTAGAHRSGARDAEPAASARPSCSGTSRVSTSRRRRSRWAAPRAASRRITFAPCRPCRARWENGRHERRRDARTGTKEPRAIRCERRGWGCGDALAACARGAAALTGAAPSRPGPRGSPGCPRGAAAAAILAGAPVRSAKRPAPRRLGCRRLEDLDIVAGGEDFDLPGRGRRLRRLGGRNRSRTAWAERCGRHSSSLRSSSPRLPLRRIRSRCRQRRPDPELLRGSSVRSAARTGADRVHLDARGAAGAQGRGKEKAKEDHDE